ncbi:MAG: hypothetical protein ACOC56_04965 [Atribacterota bacterium]
MDKNKTIVFAIFTCNRFYYFKNAFKSLVSCLDMNRIKILVVDNATIEKGFDQYLNKISNRYKNVIIKKYNKRVVGEVYRAMNWAIKWCLKEGHKVIYFMQDDYQFLFQNNRVLDDVLYQFKQYSQIVQIHNNMVWKKKHKKIGKYKILNALGTNYALLLNKPPCDNGFTRVDIYNKIGFYPDASSFKKGDSKKLVGEVWFARKCHRKKWQRTISLYPNVGMMFSSAFVRGDKRYGDYFKPPNKFYIKMFSKNRISQVKYNHKRKKWCFIEKMCEPDGWNPRIRYKRDDNIDIVNDITVPAREYS